jgi:hypothetical protein
MKWFPFHNKFAHDFFSFIQFLKLFITIASCVLMTTPKKETMQFSMKSLKFISHLVHLGQPHL